MTVMQRKKQLIHERVDSNPDAVKGLKITRAITLAIILTRLALTVYDIVFLLNASLPLPVLSYVAFGLGLIVCYLFIDGNRIMGYVLLIAAVVRALYHLASVFPILPEGAASVAFTVITLAVLALQAVLAIIPNVNKKCLCYAVEMQKINYAMQDELSHFTKK